MSAVTRFKLFSRKDPATGELEFLSGGRLYISQQLIERTDFPFEDGDLVIIEIISFESEKVLLLRKPRWWEIIDWNKNRDAFEILPYDIKTMIIQAGLIDTK